MWVNLPTNFFAVKISKMGFLDKTDPDLPELIRLYTPTDKILDSEGEDIVVTSLLEQLLAKSGLGKSIGISPWWVLEALSIFWD